MAILILGLVLFFGAHSISIVQPRLRTKFVERLGIMPWQAGYSLIALAGIVLIVWGYDEARGTALVLYTPPVWMRHLNLLLMLPIFPLLFAAYLPGRLQSVTKHPMLLSVKIWAFGHLLANGTLADLLLFGTFLVWAVAERISLKWHHAPPVAGASPGPPNDMIAIVGGGGLYLLFLFWLHRALTGVAPIG